MPQFGSIAELGLDWLVWECEDFRAGVGLAARDGFRVWGRVYEVVGGVDVEAGGEEGE